DVVVQHQRLFLNRSLPRKENGQAVGVLKQRSKVIRLNDDRSRFLFLHSPFLQCLHHVRTSSFQSFLVWLALSTPSTQTETEIIQISIGFLEIALRFEVRQ